MESHADLSLVYLRDSPRVKEDRDALAELELEEQRVSYFISNVWCRKIVNQPKYVVRYFFLIILNALHLLLLLAVSIGHWGFYLL